MMTRYKLVNGERVKFTTEEEKARDAEEKKIAEAAPAQRMSNLRIQRNRLLEESDFMGMSDYTMTDEWKTYRQALRDITKQTPEDDTLSNIKWPTAPKG